MRTQRAPQRSSRARREKPAAEPPVPQARRPRVAAAPAAAAAESAPASVLARAHPLPLPEGLYAITVGPLAAAAARVGDIVLPAVQVSAPPGGAAARVEIGFAGNGGSWVGARRSWAR